MKKLISILLLSFIICEITALPPRERQKPS